MLCVVCRLCCVTCALCCLLAVSCLRCTYVVMYVLLRVFFATTRKHIRREKLKMRSNIDFFCQKEVYRDSKRYITSVSPSLCPQQLIFVERMYELAEDPPAYLWQFLKAASYFCEKEVYCDSKRYIGISLFGFVVPSTADFRSEYRKLAGNPSVYLCLAFLN